MVAAERPTSSCESGRSSVANGGAPKVAAVAVEERLRLYEALSNRQPCPFKWKFDRQKLAEFLQRLEAKRAVQVQTQAS